MHGVGPMSEALGALSYGWQSRSGNISPPLCMRSTVNSPRNIGWGLGCARCATEAEQLELPGADPVRCVCSTPFK